MGHKLLLNYRAVEIDSVNQQQNPAILVQSILKELITIMKGK